MRTRSIALSLAVALGAGVVLAPEREARACGPDFPIELLADRRAMLLSLESGVFLDEVARLATSRYRYVTDEPAGARARGGERERALYARGAAAFVRGDHREARAAFEALLALPRDQRRHRSTWAAYMLGRLTDDPAAYARVRALVDDGFDDELGLAASSLGQQARLHLRRGANLRAIALYAEQAAAGHPDGATSLLFVARALGTGEPGELDGVVADPLGARLLAIYLWTRSDELDDAARDRLRTALEGSLHGGPELAAAAYRDGRWARAAELAQATPDAPLSIRVAAKLALRDGDRATADALLARLEAGEQCPVPARVAGERALIALSDDRLVDAMSHAWRARGSYPDAGYIAERVLSIDELVDRVEHPDTTPAPAPDGGDAAYVWLDEATLRSILARRLMRAGQHGRALRYFRDEQRPAAAAYAAAIVGARLATDPIDEARALFEASRILREHGMEIAGTTYAPDWEMHGGQFDPRGELFVDPHRPAPVIGAAEARRVADSAPRPARRFHYRYVASALAERAADVLPRRSQAFSAVLCHGARDIFNDDRVRVAHLWQRHVDEGPIVPFTPTFGQSCPQPRFTDARRHLPKPSRWPWVASMLWCLAAAAGGWTASWARERILRSPPDCDT